MEFPEEKYYRLNYIFLALIGLWPHKNSSINQIQVVLALLIYLIFIISQLIKLFTTKYNFDLLLEILSYDVLIMAWTAKYITFYVIIKDIQKIRKCVRDNWSILTDDQEVDIMRKYTDNGKLFTIIIAMSVYFGIFLFILLQYIPILFDIIMPLNESRPRLLIEAEYFVDQQKYFHVLTMHINIVILLSATTGIATESFALINAVHAFGMFKIASYRIKHMLSENVLQAKCIAQKYIIFHHRITAAVDVHRRALDLSELLKITFGRSYLLVITIIICSGSINLLHLFRVITMKQEILEIIKAVSLIFCHFLFLILGNFAGQEFINYDSYVHQTICNTEWYNAPLKAQKLILFMLQKTTKTYRVDAGGMFSPCLEGLVATMSLLFSFFTVLGSI